MTSMTSELTGLREDLRMQQAKYAALLRTARRLRDAVDDYLAPHESGSYPGSGGDPFAAARLQRLRDTFASPEVQALERE